MALATGGVGSALRKGGSAAKDAAKRLAGRERALRRDGSARDRADGPDQSDVGNGERTGESDPVDVVSGEMFTSTTDVALPGDLPLLLERHYVSGHPCGGWFGPTWAGTLDQRVELDERGIVFVADDGMVLSYPVPEAEVPVLPVSGRAPVAAVLGRQTGRHDDDHRARTQPHPALRPAARRRTRTGTARDQRPGRQPHRHRLRPDRRTAAGDPLGRLPDRGGTPIRT